MASRSKQKEEARTRRLAEEQARVERSRRERRLRMLGGSLLVAIAVVVVAVIVSSGGSSPSTNPNSAANKKNTAAVNTLLNGIPQSGVRLGSPNAKVVVTEYADLQCPVCRDFATGAENQLISSDVRSGKVQLIYKSLSTATGNGPNPNIFPVQQSAAYAAGNQNKAWQYIELFYLEQGQEGTDYVNSSYLDNLAHQVTGLDLAKWSSDRNSPSLTAQVTQDEQAAQTKGFNSTPTIVVQGVKGEAAPIVGNTDYATLESRVKSVQ
jgi:protein-disulfide isomerase